MKHRRYSQIEIDWIASFYPVHGCNETIKEMKRKFNKVITKSSLWSLCSSLNIKYEKYGYSEEEKNWLKQHAGTMPYLELTEQFNELFNKNYSYSAIRSQCLLRFNINVGNNAFTKVKNVDDLIQIFLENTDKSFKEIADIFNTKYNTKYTIKTLERILNSSGYKKTEYGHTQGNTHNETPLLSIKVNSAGFEMIKVKQGTKAKNYADGWTTLANYKYEQYHGTKLGKNEFVIFVNGNNRDYSKDNLIAITKDEWLQLNKNGFSNKGEITEAALDVIRTKKAIRSLTK